MDARPKHAKLAGGNGHGGGAKKAASAVEFL
jgi:hypothetical protein